VVFRVESQSLLSRAPLSRASLFSKGGAAAERRSLSPGENWWESKRGGRGSFAVKTFHSTAIASPPPAPATAAAEASAASAALLVDLLAARRSFQ